MTIAIDIDDTLYSFNHLARDILSKRALNETDEFKSYMRAAYVPWVEWRSPSDIISKEIWIDVVREAHSDSNIASQTPYDGAVEVIRAIDDKQEIVYVSNRDKSCYPATYEWLANHRFPLGRIICAEHHDKISLIHDCRYIVDDRPNTLVNFVYDYSWKEKYGSSHNMRKAFGLVTEYNRALTDIKGVYLAPSWKLLAFYLEKEGIIDESSKVISKENRSTRV